MTSAATLAEVTKRFPGGALALDRLSLSVPEGEILVLLGTSGSGKTTALKTINRLVRADRGQVTVLGRDIESWDPIVLRRSIGYVIQEVGLLPHLTVGENIGIVPRLLGWERARREARTRALLELVGLEPDRFAGALPRQLSGGERQRAGIARALAVEPQVLIADEPVSSLDVSVQAQVIDLLKRLQAELRLTVVIVSHDLGLVRTLCDRVVVMQTGRVVETAATEAIFTAPAHPYTRALLEASPSPDPAVAALPADEPDPDHLPARMAI
jgi:osmoprotectant transport system ATP-binding protein